MHNSFAYISRSTGVTNFQQDSIQFLFLLGIVVQLRNATIAFNEMYEGTSNTLTKAIMAHSVSLATLSLEDEPCSEATSNISSLQPRTMVYMAHIWAVSSLQGPRDVYDEFEERLSAQYTQIINKTLQDQLVAREWLLELLEASPYLVTLHIFMAEIHSQLSYPDLVAGAAYKALLLLDAITDDSDEYHESASTAYEAGLEHWASLETQSKNPHTTNSLRLQVYQLLAQSLLQCGCLQSAHFYCSKGLELDSSTALQQTSKQIQAAAATQFGEITLSSEHSNPLEWPDMGLVRRECYPWNTYEPDRLNDIDTLNSLMQAVAPKLEVKATRLPALTTSTDGEAEVVQLGVFAREDLSPGEIVLKETSLLTANNKLQDALCDACSVELPELGSESAQTVACDECQVVFCTQTCYDMAMESYHPALCDRDVESIAKDVSAKEAPDALYSLLLLRSLAMAETHDCHPLDLQEVKYIWGDFNDANDTSAKTLPFSFKYNITLPYHMLEKMDIDIFDTTKYDIWVFNTLYAKFRGTASARLSGLGGKAIRGPEVCAVHPMWCLANHSCDPNVSWEWGGEITFRTREQRVEWQGRTKSIRLEAGVKTGEEILNHYCDLDLPVQERREWARGALGGDCMCERCIWENQQLQLEKQ